MTEVVARISFFVNAGVRFVEEMCKMRAFVQLWDEITRERYGVTDDKARRFRYGVQVNSLGLTEAQPENNIQRIVLEMLGVTLSKNARARAVQLPAWNEALGLPRPWDQQWSLRMQQVLALETDLLEYEDIFDGSLVVEAKVEPSIVTAAREEMARIEEMGGAVVAVESGYLKSALVASHADRRRRVESGDEVIVGVNQYTTTEPSPLTENLDAAIMRVDPAVEEPAILALDEWRAERDPLAVEAALARLVAEAQTDANLMDASLECARAGVTTGEWANALRGVFGEFRAPTGVTGSVGAGERAGLAELRAAVAGTGDELGHRLRILVAKPGLDGHSNGAEQVAVAARDAGLRGRVPGHPADARGDRGRRCPGGRRLRGPVDPVRVPPAGRAARCSPGFGTAGLEDVPVILGGIIPEQDARALTDAGIAAVFTPKDYDLTEVMARVLDVIRTSKDLQPV